MVPYEQKLFASIRETRETVSVSHTHLYGLIKSGKIAVHKEGRRTLVRVSSVLEHFGLQDEKAKAA